MTRRDIEIAKKLKNKLSSKTEILDFKVFGSRSTGAADEYSDMDVFIEVETLARDLKEEILEISWQVGFEYNIVISPLIFTRDEVEKSPLRASSIVRNIAREGVAV